MGELESHTKQLIQWGRVVLKCENGLIFIFSFFVDPAESTWSQKKLGRHIAKQRHNLQLSGSGDGYFITWVI